MREQVNLGSKGRAIAISVAINRSRGRTERSPTLLSRSSHGGGNVCLRPIRGASGDDIIGTIVEFLSSTPSCIVCLVERTGLRAWDVETAMRVLIRTSEVELAGVCERCRIRNAFRARPRGRTGSCVWWACLADSSAVDANSHTRSGGWSSPPRHVCTIPRGPR